MRNIRLFGVLALSITILTGCSLRGSITSSGEKNIQSDVIVESTIPETEGQNQVQSESSTTETEDSQTSAEGTQAAEETDSSNQESAEGKEDESGSTESSVVSDTSNDDQYYSLVTDLSKSEVEAFAEKVKNCVVSQDWTGLASLLSDSVTIDGNTYSVEKFKQMDFSNVNADFISAIRDESCQDMFCNWQGIMLGSGEIWISEAINENGEETLCVTSINGMLS